MRTGTENGVQQVQERASDKTGTDRTTAVGSCRECWRIPANDTYVQVKSNKSAYKGVQLRVSKEFDGKEMSVRLALRATPKAAGWFMLHW